MASVKIYTDESRQNGHRYKLLGSIWILKNAGWDFVNDYYDHCLELVGQTPSHIKWTKTPNSNHRYMKFYTSLIDLYFKYNAEKKMFFRSIIVDENFHFDHPDYHQGDYEKGFYKLYYEMILHVLNNNHKYHIRVADRLVSKKVISMDQNTRLIELANSLNMGFVKKSNYTYLEDIVESIEPRPAGQRVLIQLADLFTGAVGYHWHGEHLKIDAKEGKIFLANYIAQKLERDDLRFHSPKYDRKFHIFYLRPYRKAV